MALRIEDYALIGDCQTAALVGTRRVDRLALPAAVRLGRLLRRAARHAGARPLAARPGRRRSGPSAGATATTRWSSRPSSRRTAARSRVIDFMPIRGTAPDLVRIVEGLRGRVPMRSELVIRFDYGSIVPWVQRADDGIRAIAGPDALQLHTPVRDARREPDDRRRVHRRRGAAGAVRPDLAPVPRAGAGGHRRRGGAGGHRWRGGGSGPRAAPTTATVARPGRAVAHHAQGADLRADRRDRRGRDHLAAGAASAGCGTGTTATAGCATRPSPCSPC